MHIVISNVGCYAFNICVMFFVFVDWYESLVLMENYFLLACKAELEINDNRLKVAESAVSAGCLAGLRLNSIQLFPYSMASRALEIHWRKRQTK